MIRLHEPSQIDLPKYALYFRMSSDAVQPLEDEDPDDYMHQPVTRSVFRPHTGLVRLVRLGRAP